MQKRLLILLGVFVIGVAGVGGFYWYLDSQVPKGDPQFERDAAAPEDAPTGASPVAPEA
jgi:hypothetical protein